MNLRNFGRGIVIAAVSLTLAACGINSVPAAEEEAKAKWADVEANFQRRANLVPNLAEIVRGAGQNERQILTEVTDARARATSINISADQIGDADAIAEFAAAQGQLSQGLGRLIASFEAYPEVRSTEAYNTFIDQYERSENRIAIAIRDYNEAVRAYNTTIRTFPDTIGANIIHGAEPMEPYSAVSENAEVAPDIDLTSD